MSTGILSDRPPGTPFTAEHHNVDGVDNSAQRIQLFNWDSRTGTWSAAELSASTRPSRRLLEALRGMHNGSWYGPMNCCTSGEPSARFFTIVHNLGDCALAMIYCNESKTGPVEILSVLPSGFRLRVRPEFAFEYVAFARFLGAITEAGALELHDLIAAEIATPAAPDALIFSISTGLWTSDLDHVLSNCIEKVAISILLWLSEQNKISEAQVHTSH